MNNYDKKSLDIAMKTKIKKFKKFIAYDKYKEWKNTNGVYGDIKVYKKTIPKLKKIKLLLNLVSYKDVLEVIVDDYIKNNKKEINKLEELLKALKHLEVFENLMEKK